MTIAVRYAIGAFLVFAGCLVMWLGQPQYFDYIETQYAWITPLAFGLVIVGVWVCGRELIKHTRRN
jgi:hypothetical protein